MIYKNFKDLKLSALGMGCMRLPVVDNNDSNIRIAPSFPPVAELDLAAELLCICVQLACAEKLIG